MDIFAQRARTAEGKLQVEAAQLKYLQPRLVGRRADLSRLAGGIGTRGPGETKLETDRRYIREKIRKLDEEIDAATIHLHQFRHLCRVGFTHNYQLYIHLFTAD